MDVGLSDLLTCPRCGPTYGLVLLPTEAADRRVRSGVLGCANCRERWEIADGVADLREFDFDFDFESDFDTGFDADAETESPAVRLAGLMGLAEAQGTVLVAGPGAEHAGALTRLVEGIEVVAVPTPGTGIGGTPAASSGVSPMRVTRVLPFRTGGLRGVALTGGAVGLLLEEGARVLGREGRLVVDPSPADAASRVEAGGLRVVAEEGGVLVATRRS